MIKYKVLKDVTIEGDAHVVGDVVELMEAVAAAHVESGHIEKVAV